jgi:hypothetical protein
MEEQFSKYIGHDVKVKHSLDEYTPSNGSVRTFHRYNLVEGENPVLGEIFELARSLGLKPRVMLPGEMSTCDFDTSRLTVLVSVDSEDKTTGKIAYISMG